MTSKLIPVAITCRLPFPPAGRPGELRLTSELNTIVTKLLFPAALLLLLFTCTSAFATRSPKAVQGQLDLRGWDFAENGSVELNGEWEFYWIIPISPGHPAGRPVNRLSALGERKTAAGKRDYRKKQPDHLQKTESRGQYWQIQYCAQKRPLFFS